MFAKVILALASALLLVQCAYSSEEVNAGTCSATFDKNQADSTCGGEEVTFRSAMLTKLTTLADEPLKSGKKLLEVVVAETASAEFDSGADTEVLSRILKSFKDIDAKPKQKAHVFLTLCYLLDFYQQPVTEVWKKSDVIYKAALERHDMRSVSLEFVNSYEDFLSWLLVEINTYWKTLTEEEHIEIEKFKVSCKEFKEEIPFLRKLQCFMRMFEYFAK